MTASFLPVDEKTILHALGSLYDPCSLATSRPVTIVELGLVRSVSVSAAGTVTLTLVTTSPGCLFYAQLSEAVRDTINALPGVHSVEILLDTSTAWTPADMTVELQAARRDGLLAATGVRPRQWKES